MKNKRFRRYYLRIMEIRTLQAKRKQDQASFLLNKHVVQTHNTSPLTIQQRKEIFGGRVSPPKTAECSVNTESRGLIDQQTAHKRQNSQEGALVGKHKVQDLILVEGNADQVAKTDGTATPLESIRNSASSKKRPCCSKQNGQLIVVSGNDQLKEFHQEANLATALIGQPRSSPSPMKEISPAEGLLGQQVQIQQFPVHRAQTAAQNLRMALSPFQITTGGDQLFVGGESLRERPATSFSVEQGGGHATQQIGLNPSLQIVKTLCSNKNSFLPNFKTKKRDYFSGDHKLPATASVSPGTTTIEQLLSSTQHQDINSRLSEEQHLRYVQDMQYLEELARLVKHKPKLSKIIKDTIARTERNNKQLQKALQMDIQRRKLIGGSEANVEEKIEEFFSKFYQESPFNSGEQDVVMQQVVEGILPPQVQQIIPTPPTPPIPLKTQNEAQVHHTRAVVVSNQAQIKPKGDFYQSDRGTFSNSSKGIFGGARRSYITDDVFRLATEEETNYMKFIVNEMKPNYFVNGGPTVLTKEGITANYLAAAAAAAQIMMNTPPELHQQQQQVSVNPMIQSSQIGQSNNSQSNSQHRDMFNEHLYQKLNANIDEPFISLQQNAVPLLALNELEEDESTRPLNLRHTYSFNQLASISHKRAQSQNIKVRPRNIPNQNSSKEEAIVPPQQVEDDSRSRAAQEQPMQVEAVAAKSCLTNPTSPQSSLQEKELQRKSLMEEKRSLRDDNLADGQRLGTRGDVGVVSERQSLDSSQYKTIKFQLMIMKSPSNANPGEISQNAVTDHQNEERLVGGRQSAKNFRKELKRYTLFDVSNGSPFLNKRIDDQSSFIHIGPYNCGDPGPFRRTDTHQGRRFQRLNSKFNGTSNGHKSPLGNAYGASISQLAQNDVPLTPELNKQIDDQEEKMNKEQLTIQQTSQETIVNSSVAPLSKMMSAKYKMKHGQYSHSRTGANRVMSSDIRALSSHNATAIVPFLSQEIIKNDNTRYLDFSSKQSLQGTAFEEFMMNNGKIEYLNVGGSGHPDTEHPLASPPNQQQIQVPDSQLIKELKEITENQSPSPSPTQKSGLPRKSLKLSIPNQATISRLQEKQLSLQNQQEFDIRAGGELGGGVFSASNFMSEHLIESGVDQDKCSKVIQHNTVSSFGQDQNVYIQDEKRSMTASPFYMLHTKDSQRQHHKEEWKSSKSKKRNQQLRDGKLNTDLVQMISQNDSKNGNGRQREMNKISGSHNGQTFNILGSIPQSTNAWNRGAENINQSIENSSLESSFIENKDISLQVDKGILETGADASHSILLDDNLIRNHHFFLKYIEANLKMANMNKDSFAKVFLGNNLEQRPKSRGHKVSAQLKSPFVDRGQRIDGIDGRTFKSMESNHASLSPNSGNQRNLSAKDRLQQAQTQYLQYAKNYQPNLGDKILQGRPIKPIKQLIKENFQQFALYNLRKLKEKQEKRGQPSIFIDLQGSPHKSQILQKKCPTPLFEEEGDMRLSHYIWSTIQQLQAEGYPVDMSLFMNEFSDITPPSLSQRRAQTSHQDDDHNQAFSNKIIRNANFYQQYQKDLNKQKQRNVSKAKVESRGGTAPANLKSKVEQNADLQMAFIESKEEKAQRQKKLAEQIAQSQETLRDQSKGKATDASLERQIEFSDNNLGNTLLRKTNPISVNDGNPAYGRNIVSQTYESQRAAEEFTLFSQTQKPTPPTNDYPLHLTSMPQAVIKITNKPKIDLSHTQMNLQQLNLPYQDINLFTPQYSENYDESHISNSVSIHLINIRLCIRLKQESNHCHSMLIQ